ncbi:hypothetical protein D1872_309300 [compost metagenome]
MVEALKEKEDVFYKRISDWEDAELRDFIQMLKHINGFQQNKNEKSENHEDRIF